jgi:prepilin-type N-terminal cleavage/methylation domain-containing protein
MLFRVIGVRRPAFTLVELLVVIAIIGTLIALGNVITDGGDPRTALD